MPLPRPQFPKKALTQEELLQKLQEARSGDLKWQKGKSFCLIYHPGDIYEEKVKAAYNLFFTENALNPTSFPSLQKCEKEFWSFASYILFREEKSMHQI